jgi:hypothetical protein
LQDELLRLMPDSLVARPDSLRQVARVYRTGRELSA